MENNYWTTYGNKITTIYKPEQLGSPCNSNDSQNYMTQATSNYIANSKNEFTIGAPLIRDDVFLLFENYYKDRPFDMEIIKAKKKFLLPKDLINQDINYVSQKP